jgi:hypothetical protein
VAVLAICGKNISVDSNVVAGLLLRTLRNPLRHTDCPLGQDNQR